MTTSEQEPCYDCRQDYYKCASTDCHGYHCRCDREPCA